MYRGKHREIYSHFPLQRNISYVLRSDENPVQIEVWISQTIVYHQQRSAILDEGKELGLSVEERQENSTVQSTHEWGTLGGAEQTVALAVSGEWETRILLVKFQAFRA